LGTPVVVELARSVDLLCPHCKKLSVSALIEGAAERYRGFKCQHCRLFVPAVRAPEPSPQPAG
jgi:hypothetical protein